MDTEVDLTDWTGSHVEFLDQPKLPVVGLQPEQPHLQVQDSNLSFDEAEGGSLQSRQSSSSLFADLASFLANQLQPLRNEMRRISDELTSLKRPRSPSPAAQRSRSASSSPSSLERSASSFQPVPLSTNPSPPRASIVSEHPATLIPHLAHKPKEQVDPLSITYYLPASASLHCAGCPGKANVTFHGKMYYDLTLVSISPPAVRASELLQVEVYGKLWSACSLTPLSESHSQIEAAVGLFDHHPFSEDNWSLSPKPPCLSSTAAFPIVVNTIIPNLMAWLGNNPSALKRDYLDNLPVATKIKSALYSKKQPAVHYQFCKLENPTDPLLSYLLAPVPFSPGDLADIPQATSTFCFPTIDTLTKFIWLKHSCLNILSQLILQDALSTTLASWTDMESSFPSRILEAGGLCGHLVHSLLGLLHEKLKTTLLLHIQLRHEALRGQTNSSVYLQLLNCAPLIDDHIFPKQATLSLLDTFKNLVVSVDTKLPVAPQQPRTPPPPMPAPSTSKRRLVYSKTVLKDIY